MRSAIEIYWGYFIWPMAAVVVTLLVLAAILARDAVRRARCPHDDVRLRRQVRHHQFYFAEVCMRCGKASGATPPRTPRNRHDR